MVIPASGLVDTHCHLCDTDFNGDREMVLTRAWRGGIRAVIAVGEDLNDARINLDLAAKHPMIKPAAGLYPAHADWEGAQIMADFIRQNSNQLAAIGEVGLDHWIAKETAQKELQKEIFKMFILLAEELNLPLNVHSRSAGRHAVALLLDNNARQVQLHAFDAKVASALPAVEAGYFFSIPPSIVRSPQKQKLVKHLPLSCLLAETDSPVLGPLPHERNEPANLPIVIQAIADIKGLAEETVSLALAQNTARLYRNIGLN